MVEHTYTEFEAVELNEPIQTPDSDCGISTGTQEELWVTVLCKGTYSLGVSWEGMDQLFLSIQFEYKHMTHLCGNDEISE